MEASYELHRLTSGGYKLPELRAGPFCTALNPNRHAMVIQGRPVVVPYWRKNPPAYELSALRSPFTRMGLIPSLRTFRWVGG